MTSQETVRFIAIDRLRFDPENPRLPSTVDVTDEQAVLAWMIRKETVIELMHSIGKEGYFPGEPLLAVPSAEGEGVYRVVEGNRRLAAAKLLLDPALAPVRPNAVSKAAKLADERPQSLPVLIFPRRDQIIKYLGFRHVTGVKGWDSLAKAKYLKQLYAPQAKGSPKEEFRALARTIGSNAPYVERLLVGLNIYNKIEQSGFYDIPGLGEESLSFSVLTTALSYSTISEFLSLDASAYPTVCLDQGHLRELVTWLYKKSENGRPRVPESRYLKQFSFVVAHSEALRRFRLGAALRDAAMLTEMPVQAFETSLRKARDLLRLALDYMYKIREGQVSDIHHELLGEAEQLVKDITVLAGTRIAAQAKLE